MRTGAVDPAAKRRADGPVTAAVGAAPAGAPTVQALPRRDVYAALDTSPRGLSRAEAADRLERHGPNELPPPARRPIIWRFFEQFTDLFAVVLLVASAIMLVAWLLSSPRDAGHLQLSVAIVLVVVLNAFIGFFQEYSAERTAEALQALVPRTSRVIRDGERTEVPARELVPGDVIVLEAGDAISADARVVEAHDLSVNNGALTGESAPVGRSDDAAGAATPLVEARNSVFMGTSVVTGTGKAVVTSTGIATEFGRIFRLTSGVTEEKTPLQLQVVIMAKRVATAAISLGTLLFALRVVTTADAAVDSFVFAMGVMVALVPEGLPATLSVSLAIGVRRMARRQALVKKLLAVETLGSTTVICTDKTGTLTKAEMTVQTVWASGRAHALSGVGYAPEGDVEDLDGELRDLLRVAALCSDARLLAPPGDGQGWRILGDTTEGAILVAAAKAGVDLAAEAEATPRLAEFPFDAERKLMSTVHRHGSAFESYVKGSPQELLSRCRQVRWDGGDVALTDARREAVTAANDSLATGGLRVLGVARRAVGSAHPAQDQAEGDLVLLGLVGMLDPPRPDVTEAVRTCRGAGIRVIMVTGDYGLTAEAVARRVGIVTADRPRIVSGADLDAMSELDLKGVLQAHWEILFARVKPEHKLRVVAALKEMGETVAVTGDGVNDAPALRRADIGVAMGQTGTDVSREASAMVLLDDSFASIVAAVELGRSVYQNIRKFLVYVYASNIGELVPILMAVFAGFPLVPLTALQVLAVDLGSDVMPALALGAEAPEPGIMERPPRSRAERLFSLAIVRRFLFLGGIQAAGVTFAFFWRIHSAGLGFADFTVDHPVYREALTLSQAGIVISQVFVGLAVRTDEQSIFRVGLASNLPYLAAQALGVAFMAAVSYLPLFQSLFHTAALGGYDWLLLTGFGATLLGAEEARKAWLRKRRRPATRRET